MTSRKSIPVTQRRFAATVIGALWLVCLVIPTHLFAAEWKFSGVENVVAISDVHGAYDAMEHTLKNAGVIDDSLQWSGGKTHLVITGDVLDRGPDSRKVMDLIMAMETAAEAAGGEVHLLLGNHEVMNLVGDLRYVSTVEYAAFAEDELVEERTRWFDALREEQPIAVDEDALRADFDKKHPPGFFGHRRAFRTDGKYGKWLMTKPLLIVIDETAYVHGGLSPLVADIGLEGVNGAMKSEMVAYVKNLEALNDAGILSPGVSFYTHRSALEALPIDEGRTPELTAAINTVIQLGDSIIHDRNSPLWYRGNVGCGPLIEIDRLDPALAAIGATRLVIGHTTTMSRQVLGRLGGRVTEIDTGMLNAYYRGIGNALLVSADGMSVINEKSAQKIPVTAHPRRVGERGRQLSASDLEDILEHGDILSVEEHESGLSSVTVAKDGVSIKAMFSPDPRRRRAAPELAAYRLDRFLELGMVPVTVQRNLDGKSGTLQFKPQSLTDEAKRQASGRGGDAWCPLPDQWNAMYVFDVLIHNPGRLPQQTLYNPENWQLILGGHENSFGSKRSRPAYLKDAPIYIGSAWQEKLVALTDDVLAEQFGDVLDKQRQKALSRRRDELLKDATAEQTQVGR